MTPTINIQVVIKKTKKTNKPSLKPRNQVVFYLNGKRQEVSAEQSRKMLSDYLRYDLSLTGTKVVCAEGDCGACSVLKLFPRKAPPGSQNNFIPMNSCIMTVAQMDGASLVTVDALAKENKETTELSPVQKAMLACHGSQCGFCTPGFVVAITGAIESKICSKKRGGECGLTSQEAKNALTGNLCRCTGYQPIIDAATSIDFSQLESVAQRFYSKTQEKDLKKTQSTPVLLNHQKFSIYAPTTIKDAVNYFAKHKDARLIAASTDLGVLSNKGKIKFEKLLSLHLIPELYELKKLGKGRISVGARVTLSELRLFLRDLAPQFASFLDLFASPQIKNVATLIGNVGNASPIADTPPFLLVSDAIVHIASPKGKRKVPLDQFYLDYRKTILKVGEIITSIDFAIPKKNESLALYKTSQRKDLDISIVNTAIRVSWRNAEKTAIKEINIAMGGIAATPLRFKKTENFLKGAENTEIILAKALAILHGEINPLSDLRGGSAYRRVLVENLFLKFFRENS